jgi:hypothetical protein
MLLEEPFFVVRLPRFRTRSVIHHALATHHSALFQTVNFHYPHPAGFMSHLSITTPLEFRSPLASCGA